MFQLKVQGFQGPLDLLLELIEKEEMDITSLSLAQVADQYWEQIKSDCPDPDALSEYIVVGAKLLYIKSCALLPQATPPQLELQGEKEDPGAQLTDRLQRYKKFKEAATFFQELQEKGQHAYPRSSSTKISSLSPGLSGVTLDSLTEAVKIALARHSFGEEGGVIELEPFSVDEKMDEITAVFKKSKGRLPFQPLLAECGTRTEVVVLFLAVLELIKSGHLWAEQTSNFGDIELVAPGAVE